MRIMNSVPVEIIQLGLKFDDYSGIARNVNRVLNMRDKWDDIFDRANLELPEWATALEIRLSEAMSYDREFFKEANMNYSEGTPAQGCLSASTADYLARNRHRLKLTSLK